MFHFYLGNSIHPPQEERYPVQPVHVIFQFTCVIKAIQPPPEQRYPLPPVYVMFQLTCVIRAIQPPPEQRHPVLLATVCSVHIGLYTKSGRNGHFVATDSDWYLSLKMALDFCSQQDKPTSSSVKNSILTCGLRLGWSEVQRHEHTSTNPRT